jgi:hypothetical protein
MALFNKVLGCTGGEVFNTGTPPKGIMLSPGCNVNGQDIYGNTYQVSCPSLANGGHTKIFPVRYNSIDTAAGATAYMLW